MNALSQIAFITLITRDTSALPLVEELVERGQQLKIGWFRMLALTVLAEAAFYHGYPQRGRDLADEARELAKQYYNERVAPFIFFNQGMLAIAQGDSASGIADLRMALAKVNQQRNRQVAARIESEIAHALRRAGQVQEAKSVYRSSIRRWVDLGRLPAIANQLESVAILARGEGRLEQAAMLFGAAESLREETGALMMSWEQAEYDREVAALRAGLPAGELATAWATGRALSLDAAVDFAVEI
jgi:ATP/maltotriose-dependent transcriptional regulator MalT